MTGLGKNQLLLISYLCSRYMLKFFFFILSFCLLLQCSQAAGYLQKTSFKIEQGTDDHQQQEEKAKEDLKSDQYNEYFHFNPGFILAGQKNYRHVTRQTCFPGYLHTPFLPPRRLA